MVNPISTNLTHATETTKPAAPKSQPAQQKSTALPSDTVTLKSTAGANQTSANK